MPLSHKTPISLLGGLIFTATGTLLTAYFGGSQMPELDSLVHHQSDQQVQHAASSSQPDAVSDFFWNTLYWVFDKAAWYGLSVCMFALGQCAARLQRWAEVAVRDVYRGRDSATTGAMININMTTHVLELPVTQQVERVPPCLALPVPTLASSLIQSPPDSPASTPISTPPPPPMQSRSTIPSNFFGVPKRTGVVRSSTFSRF